MNVCAKASHFTSLRPSQCISAGGGGARINARAGECEAHGSRHRDGRKTMAFDFGPGRDGALPSTPWSSPSRSPISRMCHSLVLQPSYAALRYFPGHNGDLSRPSCRKSEHGHGVARCHRGLARPWRRMSIPWACRQCPRCAPIGRLVFMAWGKARFLPDFAQYLADELARHPRRKVLGCDLITWVRRLSAKPWRN